MKLAMLRHPSDDNDDLVLAVNINGKAIVSIRGHDFSLGEREAILVSRREVDRIIRLHPDCFLVFPIPRGAISSSDIDASDAIGRTIPSHSPPLQLLIQYLGFIQDGDFPATPELESAILAHIRDLIGLMMEEAPDIAVLANNRRISAERLRALKIYVLANINDSKFSLAGVAARQGISASYVRKLFESDGTSFTEFVLDQRLLRAHRMLVSPRFADHTISVIALNVGFHDLSYFNRVFRRRFGNTPSQIRLAAQNKNTK